jgi:hypothetical protein
MVKINASQVIQWVILTRIFQLAVIIPVTAQPPQIGGYHVYYGNIHNHCEFSDGTGIVTNAYQAAKFSAKMDFFSLSDHGEMLSSNEWSSMKATADIYNENEVFTAFWGFEWSSPTEGHLTIIGSDDYCSCLYPGTSNFKSLNTWLNSRSCAAFLNHPGDFDVFNDEFNHITTNISERVVGMELWNGGTGFSRYYYNNGYNPNDGGLGFYDEALVRGWRIGASGAEDNHSATWGMGQFRMAVLANALTRDSIMKAFKERRFYSTLDKNIEMSFKINGNEMGSVINPGFHNGEIRLHDADDEIFTSVVLIHKGVAEDTFLINDHSPVITFHVNAQQNDYYYIVVTQQDADQAISSPVYFNNNPATGLLDPVNGFNKLIIRYTADYQPFVFLPEEMGRADLIITDLSGYNITTLSVQSGEKLEISPSVKSGIYLVYIAGHPELGCQKIVCQ